MTGGLTDDHSPLPTGEQSMTREVPDDGRIARAILTWLDGVNGQASSQ
jgi:hypothetical protein